jgi:hypothetical protein
MNDKETKLDNTPSTTGINRRAFLQGGLGALAAVLLLGKPALAEFLDVRFVRRQTENTPLPEESGGLRIRPRAVDNLAKPFLDEKIEIDITFMGAKLAMGTISFKRVSNWSYEATIETHVTGAVSPLVKHRQQTMTALMTVKKVNGKDRFVTSHSSRKTITTEKTVERKHEFNYYHRRWVYTRLETGKPPKVWRRKIARNTYYDDFCNILYNTRAQFYAPLGSGKVVLVHTIPWTRWVTQDGARKKYHTETLTLVFPKPEEISAEDRQWLNDEKAEVMIVAKVDRDAYEIKSGELKFAGDKNAKPLAAWVKDALLYGDVRATVRR